MCRFFFYLHFLYSFTFIASSDAHFTEKRWETWICPGSECDLYCIYIWILRSYASIYPFFFFSYWSFCKITYVSLLPIYLLSFPYITESFERLSERLKCFWNLLYCMGLLYLFKERERERKWEDDLGRRRRRWRRLRWVEPRGGNNSAQSVIVETRDCSRTVSRRGKGGRRNYRRINRPRECVSLIKWALAMIINNRWKSERERDYEKGRETRENVWGRWENENRKCDAKCTEVSVYDEDIRLILNLIIDPTSLL